MKNRNLNESYLMKHALFTSAKLTIKDNNDIIVVNPERRKYSIKITWRYESKNNMCMYCHFIHFLFNNFII